jgi:hypothetical protein
VKLKRARDWPELVAAVETDIDAGRRRSKGTVCRAPTANRNQFVYIISAHSGGSGVRRIDEIGEQFGAGAQERRICRDR